MFNEFFTFFISFFSLLSVASIAAIISERVGIINISIDGTIAIGATFYMLFAHFFSSKGTEPLNEWIQIPLFFISGFFGWLFSLLHGYATIKLKANHIVSGVALNILAPAITLLMLTTLGTSNALPFPPIELAVGNSANYEWTNVFSLKVFVAIFIIIFFFILMNKTKWGLRVKSVGENPNASDAAGIKVNSIKWQGLMISGLLAGVAGAIFMSMAGEVNGGSTFKGTVNGYGYLALAIMIMGKWRIGLSTISTIFFSIIFSVSKIFPNLVEKDIADLYGNLLYAIPYVGTILVLMIFSKNSYAPKAAGLPFDKSKR
ncbi:MAG: ABC transporter permease [Metamycoplasmataceae bacterium]